MCGANVHGRTSQRKERDSWRLIFTRPLYPRQPDAGATSVLQRLSSSGNSLVPAASPAKRPALSGTEPCERVRDLGSVPCEPVDSRDSRTVPRRCGRRTTPPRCLFEAVATQAIATPAQHSMTRHNISSDMKVHNSRGMADGRRAAPRVLLVDSMRFEQRAKGGTRCPFGMSDLAP